MSDEAQAPAPKKGRLLVVDNDARLMKALCDTLETQGFSPRGFTEPAVALEALRHEEFDILLTDLHMPEMDGIALLTAAIAVDPHIVCIVMTGNASIQTAVKAIKRGAFDYVEKPLTMSELAPSLSRALEVRHLRRENLQLRETIGIHELSVAIGNTLDVDTILDELLDSAMRQCDADEGSVLMVSPDGRSMQVVAARGNGRRSMCGISVPLDRGIAGWVATHREPVVLNGRVADPRFAPAFPREQISSAICMPMMVAGKCIGVLNVNSTREQRTYTAGKVKALTVLAGTAAPALKAASLLADVQTAKEEWEQCFDAVADHIAILSEKGAILRANRPMRDRFRATLGELEGVDFRTVYPTAEPLPSGASVSFESHIESSAQWFFVSCYPMRGHGGRQYVVAVGRDVTERRQLETQLRQSQKMEAFGQLAGGVAHDFNNLLTVISGFSELLLMDEDGLDEAQRDFVDEIRRASDRAASLTRQLLAFSRKQILQPENIIVNELVSEMQRMLQRLIGENIHLRTELDPDLGTVRIDPGQFEQVILNLVVNSRDAMRGGGTVTIETRNQSESFVQLAVTDTGCGMDETTKAKIFEPFFTTKPVGEGTGLGLATVHGIVKQSGGSIEVESEVGRGTTFRIQLPRLQGKSEALRPVHHAAVIPRGEETILVAEDEEGVRSTIRITLEGLGYTVLEASNGGDAIGLSRSHRGAIDLLVTDVVMPGIGGRQLAEAVRAVRPELKVLYISGYTDDAILRAGSPEAGVAFLQKPFTPVVLGRKVRESLN